jgi:hypothetical protein
VNIKVMSNPEFAVASGVLSYALAVQTVLERVFPRFARVSRVLLVFWAAAVVWAGFGIQAAVVGNYVYVGRRVLKREALVRVEVPSAPTPTRSLDSAARVIDTRGRRIEIDHSAAAQIAAFFGLPVVKYSL